MDVKIYPTSNLNGQVEVPTSKSQTLRALFSSLFVQGISLIHDALDSDDSKAMIRALMCFGIKIVKKEKTLVVHSPGFHKLKAPKECYVESSGIALRFLSAFAAHFHTSITFIGSSQLNTQRSIKELERGLNALGVKTKSNAGFCPFTVCGPIKNRRCLIQGQDSQPVSALLWLLSCHKKTFELHVVNPGETPWVDLTLSWLKKQKKYVLEQGHSFYRVKGPKQIAPFIYKVPKDFSSAAFMIAAGLTSGQKLVLPGFDFLDPQGDKKLIYVLQKAGGYIQKIGCDLVIKKTKQLDFTNIDMQDFIDALPVLAALGTSSKTKLVLKNAHGARGKESDRIHAMTSNLEILKAPVIQTHDSMIVYPAVIEGGTCEGFNDHRIVMATAILALKAKAPITIKGACAVSKTYPNFFEDLAKIGVSLEVIQ